MMRPIVRYIFFNSSSFLKYSTKSNSLESTNQLIKTLNSRADYKRAFQLFDNLIKQNNVNVVSLLNIIDTCSRSADIERARQIEFIVNQSIKWKNHIRLQTSLINMYMKLQMIDQAERIFENIRQYDIIVYNAMLKGYLRNQKAERCFEFIDKMPSNILPDNVTYILLLNACTILRDTKRGIELHKKLSLSLTDQHVHLQNALIDFYGRINQIETAEKIFHDMSLRETSTFNSLMKAYLVNNMPFKVLELFEQMKQNDFDTIGPMGFKADLITFMAVCDACEKIGLLDNPDSSYGEFNWNKIFSTTIK